MEQPLTAVKRGWNHPLLCDGSGRAARDDEEGIK
jgi:hypothetical protein